MRKQIYNLNCRKQTSGVPGAGPRQGQRPWRGPRGSAPGGGPSDRSVGGGQGAAPLTGDRGRSPRNKNKLLTS